METARPFAPETRSRDRLWFGFRPDKLGKRPGFTDSTGEYRDTRTGWLGREDSNLRMPESKSGALPLGYAPIDASGLACAAPYPEQPSARSSGYMGSLHRVRRQDRKPCRRRVR